MFHVKQWGEGDRKNVPRETVSRKQEIFGVIQKKHVIILR